MYISINVYDKALSEMLLHFNVIFDSLWYISDQSFAINVQHFFNLLKYDNA